MIELDEFSNPCLEAKVSLTKLLDYNVSNVYTEIVDAISSKSNSRIVDAIYAILELLNLHKKLDLENEIYKIITLICEQIKWRREDSLVSSLNAMSNIVFDFPEYLNEELLEDVILGLKHLINESSPEYAESNMDISKKLSCRKSAANLAFRLYQYYSDRKEVIPQVILDWEKNCLDQNEFAEICNQWIWYN